MGDIPSPLATPTKEGKEESNGDEDSSGKSDKENSNKLEENNVFDHTKDHGETSIEMETSSNRCVISTSEVQNRKRIDGAGPEKDKISSHVKDSEKDIVFVGKYKDPDKPTSDTTITNVKLLTVSKEGGTVKPSNEDVNIEDQQSIHSKIKIVKSESSERIIDVNNKTQSEEHSDIGKKTIKEDKKDAIPDTKKTTENKESVIPVKKKVKSFASAMSLFLKSKKDTSYVENPVKGKKTGKKLKKRRSGIKKANQPAKSPNPNNSENKQKTRKKRKIQTDGESRVTRSTRSSQRLKPQSD